MKVTRLVIFLCLALAASWAFGENPNWHCCDMSYTCDNDCQYLGKDVNGNDAWWSSTTEYPIPVCVGALAFDTCYSYPEPVLCAIIDIWKDSKCTIPYGSTGSITKYCCAGTPHQTTCGGINV